MARWHRLGMAALILLVAGGCAQSSSPKGQAVDGQGQLLVEVKPAQNRFSKADNSVITDNVTGLEWYVGPGRDYTWHQAKAWAETLNVAGGSWRLPTLQELKALYLKGASPINMDPLFQANGAWVWSGDLNNSWSAWGFAFYSGLEGWHHLDYPNGRIALAVCSRR